MSAVVRVAAIVCIVQLELPYARVCIPPAPLRTLNQLLVDVERNNNRLSAGRIGGDAVVDVAHIGLVLEVCIWPLLCSQHVRLNGRGEGREVDLEVGAQEEGVKPRHAATGERGGARRGSPSQAVAMHTGVERGCLKHSCAVSNEEYLEGIRIHFCTGLSENILIEKKILYKCTFEGCHFHG